MKESLADQLARLTGQPPPEKPKRHRNFSPVTEEYLNKGHVLLVPLSEDEGLVVKGEYESQNKFVTIIGIAADGSVIGSLLINTIPNEATPEFRNCQYLLRVKDYPTILDYDSWLDCSQLFRIPKAKVMTWGGYCGKITDMDWEYIETFLVETDVLSNKIKKEFGLIE